MGGHRCHVTFGCAKHPGRQASLERAVALLGLRIRFGPVWIGLLCFAHFTLQQYFLPVRPGTYEFYVVGYRDEGMLGQFVVK